MTLQEYIREVGIGEFAYRLGVSVPCVKSWLYRQREPRTHKALEIVKKTSGRVTLHEIYLPRRKKPKPGKVGRPKTNGVGAALTEQTQG